MGRTIASDIKDFTDNPEKPLKLASGHIVFSDKSIWKIIQKDDGPTVTSRARDLSDWTLSRLICADAPSEYDKDHNLINNNQPSKEQIGRRKRK